jgi:hypothetical protein
MEKKKTELALLAHEITEKIKEIVRDTTLNFYQTGELLKQVRDQKLWLASGCESFESYIADPELGISRTSAYNAIQLVENFKYKEIRELDYSKVTKIIPALSVAPKEKLLELAGTLSRGDLSKEVATIMGKDENVAKPVPFIFRCPKCGKIKGIGQDDVCTEH